MLSARAERVLNKLCNTWEISPAGYVDTDLGRVYIAEGWQAHRPNQDGTHEGPGWTMLWCLWHAGMPISRAMYINGSDPAQRRQLVLDDAYTFLKNWHDKENKTRH